jgi:hypothetical protein
MLRSVLASIVQAKQTLLSAKTWNRSIWPRHLQGHRLLTTKDWIGTWGLAATMLKTLTRWSWRATRLQTSRVDQTLDLQVTQGTSLAKAGVKIIVQMTSPRKPKPQRRRRPLQWLPTSWLKLPRKSQSRNSQWRKSKSSVLIIARPAASCSQKCLFHLTFPIPVLTRSWCRRL